MDKETAHYIITYFSNLLTGEEKLAIKHTRSTFKIDCSNRTAEDLSRAKNIYLKMGWLTENQNVLDLLKDGYDSFEIKVAERILKGYPEKVLLNNCPNCGKLARTPNAKQCRFCSYDWR